MPIKYRRVCTLCGKENPISPKELPPGQFLMDIPCEDCGEKTAIIAELDAAIKRNRPVEAGVL